MAATAVFFHRAALEGQIFIAGDIQRVYFPLRKYWVERVSRGEFPAWYPYDGLGQPFAGMIISAAFHPANLLYLLLPLGSALTVNVLVCFPVAFLGVYVLARGYGLSQEGAALAGVAFAFCGYLVSVTENLLYLMAAATTPWALAATDRFLVSPSALRATMAAVLLSLVLLAGDAQGFVVCASLTLVIAVARHRPGRTAAELARLGSVLLLAGLVSAAQLTVLLQTGAEARSVNQSLAQAQVWSVHPLRLLELALGPLFEKSTQDAIARTISRDLLGSEFDTLWADSLHVGLPVLLLAAIGVAANRTSRRTWLVVSAALVVLLLALGKYTPLYGLAFAVVPGWRAFRYPEKLVPFVTLGIALGAGAGLDALQDQVRMRSSAFRAIALGAVVCLAGLVLEWWTGLFSRHLLPALWNGSPDGLALDRLGIRFTRDCAGSAVALLGLLAVLVLPAAALRGRLAVGLVLAHLFAANHGVYNVARPSVLTQPGRFVAAIESAQPRGLGGYRAYSLRSGYAPPRIPGMSDSESDALAVSASLGPVVPALWNIEASNAYLPAASFRVRELERDGPDYFFRYAPLFATRYFAVAEELQESLQAPGSKVLAADPTFKTVLLTSRWTRRRAYLARPHCVATREDAYHVLVGGELDPGEVVVECARTLAAVPPGARPRGRARISIAEPEHVVVQVRSEGDAILVLNDAFYSGWTAKIDGRREEILAVNYAVRGVPVGAGRHTVVFTFRTPYLRLGVWISVLSLATALAIACRQALTAK